MRSISWEYFLPFPSSQNALHHRYIGRTQKELIRFMRESNLRRPPFERPSTARRAHPTVLTGPNYAHARVGTMSMTLRSKSADHRRHQLLDSSQLRLHGGILGSSRSFLDQVGTGVNSANQLKRAHSSFVPNAANIGLSTGAMATSGYSTMGGSSSGGHLAGDDGESLEGSEAGAGAVERNRELNHEELMGPMVPPSGIIRTDFDGQPSPVATVPAAVVASSTSINRAAEASSNVPPPPKPSRMTVSSISSNKRQDNEYSSYTGTLRRQASLADHRPVELFGRDRSEEVSSLRTKQMSTSTLHNFSNQPSTPVQVLMSGIISSTTTAPTGTANTIVTTAQVRTPYTNDTPTGEMQLVIGSERNLQPYKPYREVS
ncbi:unnamed protein product [Rodentolepis nana]|uniref:FERM adjacent (FA) domain-containing protein n=1 Tax=Rodentolepis nana TaxID=102285 RepID=A0A0R3T8L4_RODNA|nr:unnamed protein product [Rodentolepis nana]